MKTSVIISTYNSPNWLQKVLWGFAAQSRHDFEIIIADDGSTADTSEMIAAMAPANPVPLTHVWQPDKGFEKCRILNKAIALARGERILVTDGDCVPRSDFVDIHTRLARDDRFLTGTYFKLPPALSAAITQDDILSRRAFSARWLLGNGLPFSPKFLKLLPASPFGELLNRITPTKETWNGHSASCLRSQAIEVNGFNEDMQYGGLDVEFGLRLRHIGIEPRHIRYSTVTMHLHHGHDYVTAQMRKHSHEVKENTRNNRLTRAERGLDQWLDTAERPRLPSEDRVTRF